LIKVLLLGDTHLGLDLPRRPRVTRPRRGHDFLRNYKLALEPARRGEVDLVIHGGDLFHKRDADPGLVQIAMAPLQELAEGGTHVALVPGNHEGGRIPCPLLARHPLIHIFHAPGALTLEIRGIRMAVGGFPFQRRIGETFSEGVEQCGILREPADIRVLAMHQSVEGAQVGPVSYTFRPGRDVIRGAHLSRRLAAVLSGHIHRRQVLTHDLNRRPLPSPVLYPGSVERTSSAERHEPKGYITLELAPDRAGGRLVSHRFIELPTGPPPARRMVFR